MRVRRGLDRMVGQTLGRAAAGLTDMRPWGPLGIIGTATKEGTLFIQKDCLAGVGLKGTGGAKQTQGAVWNVVRRQ